MRTAVGQNVFSAEEREVVGNKWSDLLVKMSVERAAQSKVQSSIFNNDAS